jgi:hypothetical protein
MQRATFSGRRGIEPRSAGAARLAGWELVVDKPPLISMAQSFANLVEAPGAEVFGVLYELSAEDYAHVEFSEAVPIGNYRAVEVRVGTLSEPVRHVRARTLVSERRAPGMRPSTRYMQLMIEGAREHELPAEWVRFLCSVPSNDETEEDIRLRGLLDRVIGKKKPR